MHHVCAVSHEQNFRQPKTLLQKQMCATLPVTFSRSLCFFVDYNSRTIPFQSVTVTIHQYKVQNLLLFLCNTNVKKGSSCIYKQKVRGAETDFHHGPMDHGQYTLIHFVQNPKESPCSPSQFPLLTYPRSRRLKEDCSGGVLKWLIG